MKKKGAFETDVFIGCMEPVVMFQELGICQWSSLYLLPSLKTNKIDNDNEP